jgi:DNA-binding GntR family transcriptional regulator
MSKTIDTRSLIEDAYRKLKQFMLQQKIVPGQKLLYRELSDLLHMSKTPIVNALNRLEQEGFVASEPNCGYYLKPINVKEITDSSEVREALEARAVQQAIQLGNPDDMALLEKKLLTLEAYPPLMHNKKRFVLNAEFHLQIADISRNRVLKYLLKRNFEHIILRVNLDKFASESTAASNQEHRQLLASLKKGDIAKSMRLVQKHIQKTKDLIIRFLSREELEELETMEFFEEGRRSL